jgi:hypothetical protein
VNTAFSKAVFTLCFYLFGASPLKYQLLYKNCLKNGNIAFIIRNYLPNTWQFKQWLKGIPVKAQGGIK